MWTDPPSLRPPRWVFRPVSNKGIAEFAGLENDRLENDGLDVSKDETVLIVTRLT